MIICNVKEIIQKQFSKVGNPASIPLLRGTSFKAELTSAGVYVNNLAKEPFLPWEVFIEAVAIIEKKGGKATKGDAMNSKLGDPGLPIDSIEGWIAKKIYGKQIGDSVFRRITPIACILVWAGICINNPGELELAIKEEPSSININKLQEKLRKFAKDRNWDQYHSPKNLTMALAGEVGELLEIFQWLTEEQSNNIINSEKDKIKVEEEIADVFIYLVRLADKLNVDIKKAVADKISKNAEKYPVELSRDNAVKYNKR